VNTAFLVFLLAYVGWAGLAALRHRLPEEPGRTSLPALALQTPLFLLAYWLAWRHGVFTRALVSPLAVVLGLALGHLVFAFSLYATHRVWRDTLSHACDLRGLGGFLADNPVIMMRFFSVATVEEIIYRAAAQPLLLGLPGGAWTAIAATALLFSLVHDHFYHNSAAGSAEFLAFALLLGLLYHVTGSLTLVIMVHVMRNLESVYLEYLVLVDETGDPEQARLALNSAHTHRPTESL
jgi:membrane protease YdiL (CAAX protease family)